MVGLTVILETTPTHSVSSTELTHPLPLPLPQVINKATAAMINNLNPSPPPPSSSSSSRKFQTLTFLDHCFLCGLKLLPGKDIFMYEGDKGFCSVECRCRQIFIDEEEGFLKGNCSFSAMKPQSSETSPYPSSSSSSSGSRRRKASRNRGGGFAY